TYYIRKNVKPEKKVELRLAVNTGSILEDNDQRGLAHFMEHMNFNGTTHFPKNELINYLQKSGVRFGADINAYTGFDETVYQLPLPTDDPSIVKNGLQIMRDWAKGATLDPVEINKERGVILEEKRLGQGAEERMRRQYWPILFNGSRYTQRLPIGTEEVLTTFKPAVINAYYNDWYRPDLQALIIVGDIDVNAMEKLVKLKFADLKNPIKEKLRVKYAIPLTGKNQFIAVTDKEMTATVAQVIIKHKASPLITKADYRTTFIRQLYNQMLGQRYAELNRQSDPPFIQGSAGTGDFLGGLDSYTATVVAKPGEFEKGFKAVWRETIRAKRFGFTQSELDRAKVSYRSAMESALKEKNKTKSEAFVNEYLQYFLNKVASPGIATEFKIVEELLPGINLAEVNKVNKDYINEVNRDILLMAPEKDKNRLPGENQVNDWMKAVASEQLKPYEDVTSKNSLLSAEPLTGKIIKEEKNSELNIIMLTMSNGVKIILKPTEFKNNEIQFSAFAPGGTSLYSNEDFQS
ncbi:MAG: insulinase family protein, partial [Chitinophagaceae bacterium]